MELVRLVASYLDIRKGIIVTGTQCDTGNITVFVAELTTIYFIRDERGI